MLMLRFVMEIFSVSMMVFAAGSASGQNYPEKPIRIYAPQAGTSVDSTLRLVAGSVTGSLGQRFIVENRGIIGVEIVARASPDGYSLINYTNPLWLMPLLQDNVSWDPVKDFSPICLTVNQPTVLVVHPSVPVKSVKELIVLAKARPGALNYSSTSTGNANHISAELFKAMAGVNIVRINYKGGAQAINDLVAGQVHLQFGSAGVVMPYVKLGRLRGLAVASAEPSALAPGLPTIAAAGLPGYESTASTGLFAPARTPAAIINLLNQEFVRSLKRADVKERLFNAAIEVVASSPEQLATTIKSEMATIGKVVKEVGLREKG